MRPARRRSTGHSRLGVAPAPIGAFAPTTKAPPPRTRPRRLPRLWLSGYDLDQAHECALELNSPELGTLRRTAADTATAIVVGFPERRDDDRVANAVALIDERGEQPTDD